MRACLVFAIMVIHVGSVTADPLSNPWVQCGVLSDIRPSSCQIASRPSTLYEYAITYNSAEPVPVQCTWWSTGIRVANKQPYLIYSDNPNQGMYYGGFVFYVQTKAPDECTAPERFRQRYWRLDANNNVTTLGSNGCYSQEIPVFCRTR